MIRDRLFKLEREAEQRVHEARDREIDRGGPGSARRASEAMNAPMLEVAAIRRMRQRLGDKQMEIDHQRDLLRRPGRNRDLPREVKGYRIDEGEAKLTRLTAEYKALEAKAEERFLVGVAQAREQTPAAPPIRPPWRAQDEWSADFPRPTPRPPYLPTVPRPKPKPPVIMNPTGGKRRDDRPGGLGSWDSDRVGEVDGGTVVYKHRATDVEATPGQTVVSPITGRVTHTGVAYGEALHDDEPEYGTVHIEGMGEYEGLKIKLFYVDTGDIEVGDEISVASLLGTAQDIRRRWGQQMTPHVHLQVYWHGLRIDPETVLPGWKRDWR